VLSGKSSRHILSVLGKLKAVDQKFLENRIYNITKLKPEQLHFFKALGVPVPERVILQK